MKCWWMMPFGVWKSADVLLFSAWCEMVVLGRGREPALERELPPPPPHQQSAWQLQWGGCLRTFSDGAAPCARGKGGWAEEHDTAWLQHVASSPAMYCRPGAAWGCPQRCSRAPTLMLGSGGKDQAGVPNHLCHCSCSSGFISTNPLWWHPSALAETQDGRASCSAASLVPTELCSSGFSFFFFFLW